MAIPQGVRYPLEGGYKLRGGGIPTVAVTVLIVDDNAPRSYWIPGSFETSSSMSEPSNALPRFRTL
jgi:hypothetical protein